MTKAQILELVQKITVSFKGIFPSKTQVASDIAAAKTEVKAYTDSAVADATNDAASTTYVDNKVADINNTITSFQSTLNSQIDARVSAFGTFVGVADTYAELPTTDTAGNAVTAGDIAYLRVNDGDKAKGYYRYTGTQYEFLSGDPTLTEIFDGLKYTQIDDTDDTHFVTGKYIKDREDQNSVTQAEVDDAVANA